MKKYIFLILIIIGTSITPVFKGIELTDLAPSSGRYWKGEYIEYQCPSTVDLYNINFLDGSLEYGCIWKEGDAIQTKFDAGSSYYHRSMVYQGESCGSGVGRFTYGDWNSSTSMEQVGASTYYDESLPCKDHGVEVD